ncbi:MAG: zinc-binding dehydrogenase [Conexibacter sp.]|nr:zinc-binding dehydrogenase [Conexibacter sp.]
MTTTRRVVELREFGAPDVMAWADAPAPERGPDEVRIAVEAIGVNFADTMVRRGEYRRDQSLRFTPGFEVAGRVLEGPDDGPAAGTRVAAFTNHGGGYADQVVAPRAQVVTVPDEVPATAAASLLIQGVTGWYAVHRFGQVTAGQTVLIHGASGGLGALMIQLAVEAGASVIGTASTAAKLEVARGHGASVALLSDPGTLADEVRAATGGGGVEVVLDGVGGPVFKPSMRALAHCGRYVVVGSASQQPAEIDTRVLMPRAQTIVGFIVARVTEREPDEPQAAFDAVLERYRDGRLVPEVTVVGPHELVHAHELIGSRRHTGKLVIDLAAGA